MRRPTLAAIALALGGCSFLFDPAQVGPGPGPRDLAVGPADLRVPDLAGTVDDLAPPPDLTDVSDLAQPSDLTPAPDLLPCVPPLFPGFLDAGAPFDCRRCGCVIDDLVDATKMTTRWTAQVPALGWTALVDGGTAAMVAPAPNSGEAAVYYSLNHFYLSGDFDVLLDYAADTWSPGGYIQLVALGPPNDAGVNDPSSVAQAYNAAGNSRVQLIAQDRLLDVPLPSAQGTLEIARSGSMLCVSSGGNQVCRANESTAPAYLQFGAVVQNAACSAVCVGAACCSYRARFSNLRLKTGVIVSSR